MDCPHFPKVVTTQIFLRFGDLDQILTLPTVVSGKGDGQPKSNRKRFVQGFGTQGLKQYFP